MTCCEHVTACPPEAGGKIPAENLLGEEGQGFRLAQGWLTIGRVKGHGARCVGIAERALELAIAYAANRVTYGEA